jgi:hypothetical protein
MRSIRYQMHSAKFPVHRDLAGFDFESIKVDQGLIDELATLAFTEQAHNVVFIGGTGTGKTHLATALGRLRHHPTRQAGAVLLDGRSGQSARAGEGRRQGRAAGLLAAAHGSGDPRRTGLLPFSQAGGALLFHLLSKLYEHTSVMITTNLTFGSGPASSTTPR